LTLTWDEFEQAAPEIAVRGRELIERFQFIFVGTLTRDGSPRVTPVEAYIVDGHLLVNMIPRSLKALDLLRDPRVYMHAPVTAKSGDAELKLAGSADVLEDQGLRTKLDDLFWEMIEWRPAPDSHYFELRMARAAFVTYDGQGQTAIRWHAGAEEARTYRPGI
jgi:hypothetical protein